MSAVKPFVAGTVVSPLIDLSFKFKDPRFDVNLSHVSSWHRVTVRYILLFKHKKRGVVQSGFQPGGGGTLPFFFERGKDWPSSFMFF